MSLPYTYEIFYASGGHFGPFDTCAKAELEAIRRLERQPDVYGGAIRVRRGTTGTWISRYRCSPTGAVFQRPEGGGATWSRCAWVGDGSRNDQPPPEPTCPECDAAGYTVSLDILGTCSLCDCSFAADGRPV